jgi:hypothetical protein
MAEREGFEPPIPLRVCLISSQVHSTGLCHLSALEARRPSAFPSLLAISCHGNAPPATAERGVPWHFAGRPAHALARHTPRVHRTPQRRASSPARPSSYGVLPHRPAEAPACCARLRAFSWQARGSGWLSTIKIIVSGSFGLTVIPLVFGCCCAVGAIQTGPGIWLRSARVEFGTC